MSAMESWAPFVGLIGGGVGASSFLFTMYKHYKYSEQIPRLTFTVDMIQKFRQGDYYVCEVVAEIENVGNVGVEIDTMTFALHGIREDDPLEQNLEELNYQVTFPRKVKSGTWLNESYVEPKTPQKYSHVCAVPMKLKAVLVFGRIKYSNSDQTAQTIITFRAKNKRKNRLLTR